MKIKKNRYSGMINVGIVEDDYEKDSETGTETYAVRAGNEKIKIPILEIGAEQRVHGPG